ncbi:MAG: hypothetical protein RIT15_279, partial [Pseudomonadota bacterium]
MHSSVLGLIWQIEMQGDGTAVVI